jgi:hypothetical protein
VAMVAGQLEVQMLADMARLASDMQAAKRTVTDAMSGIESAVAKAKAALGALGIGVGVGYFASLIKGSIDAADHLNDLSKSTDITVENLAGLSLLAKQTGTDIDGLAKAVDRMSVEIGKNPDKFRALGITAKDQLGAFKQLADLFNTLTDSQQRNALAQSVFSRSWAEIAPALSEGSQGIQDAIDKSRAMSGITKQMAEEADHFNDRLAELNVTLGHTRNQAVGELLPALNEIARAVEQAARESGLLTAAWVALGGAMALVLGLTDAQQLKSKLREADDAIAQIHKDMQQALNSPDYDNPRGVQAIEQMRQALKDWEAERSRITAKAAPQFTDANAFSKQNLQAVAGAEGLSVFDPAAAAAAERAKAFIEYEKRLEEARREEKLYTSSLQALEQQLGSLNQQTEVQKILYQETAGSLQKLSGPHKAHLLDIAAEIDKRKLANAQLESEARYLDAVTQKREAADTVLGNFLTTQGQYVSDLQFEIDLAKQDSTLNGAGLLQKQDEIRLTAQVNQQKEIAVALRKLENDYLTASAGLQGADVENLTKQYNLRREQIPVLIAERDQIRMNQEVDRQRVAEFNQLWSTVEQTGRTVFELIFSSGKNAMEGIGRAIKASVIDLLYQLTVRKWIINIGTSFGDSVGVSALSSATGGGVGSSLGSGLGSMFSSGASALGLSNLLGAGTAGGSAWSTGAGAAALADGSIAGEAAAGAGAAGGMSALAATGWGAAAVAAYMILSGKGSSIPIIGGLFGGGKDNGLSNINSAATLSLVQGAGGFMIGQDIPGRSTGKGPSDSVTDDPRFAALMQALNDPSMFDQSKLSGLVGNYGVAGGQTMAAGLTGLLSVLQSAAIVKDGNQFADPAAIAKMQADAQKQAADAAHAQQVADARRQIEIQLMEAQGDTVGALAARRQQELDALDETLRPLQQQIYAAQDLAKAQADAAAAEQQHAQQIAQLTDQEKSAVQSLQGAVGDLSGKLGISALQGAITGLSTSDYLSPIDKLAGARGQFDTLLTQARSGNLDAVGSFPGAVQTLLSAGRDVYASGPEFQNLFREANSALQDVLRQQQDEQSRILSSVPVAIQQASIDQIGELRRGFAAMVDQLEQTRADLRRLAA